MHNLDGNKKKQCWGIKVKKFVGWIGLGVYFLMKTAPWRSLEKMGKGTEVEVEKDAAMNEIIQGWSIWDNDVSTTNRILKQIEVWYLL